MLLVLHLRFFLTRTGTITAVYYCGVMLFYITNLELIIPVEKCNILNHYLATHISGDE